MTSYFVTGTDTGVGKTTISAALLRAARARGRTVAALKPAETGCDRSPDGTLLPADGLALRAACGMDDIPLEAIVPHRFATPVAPAVAARREPDRPRFSVDRTRTALETLRARRPDLILVEGAGGLLVPFDEQLLAADLVRELDLPLLIVARASLGTINHTLLTIFEARRRQLRVAGVILNRTLTAKGPDEESNAAEIARLADVRVLGTFPHIPSEHADATADAIATNL
jgi:dethiobiotin synthetase